MNWDAIGAIGEVRAALVVVVTLFLLVMQIRQSNRFGRANAECGWFVKWHDLIRATAADEEAATAFRKGLSGCNEPTKSERAVFSRQLVALMDHVEVAQRLNGPGLPSDDLLSKNMRVCMAFTRTPRGREWSNDVGPYLRIYEYFGSLHREGEPPVTESISFYRAE